jgi:hypothetical protein
MDLNRISESRNRKRGKDDVLQEFGTVYPVPIGLARLRRLDLDFTNFRGSADRKRRA